MANMVPFTAYAKIVPERGDGKRWELRRSRERIAYLVHNDLVNNLTVGNIAHPGGDGVWGLAEDASSLSLDINTVAVKPQMGQDPDLVTIVGFYDGDAAKVPYSEISVIHAGETRTGPLAGAPGWRADLGPSANSVVEVKALKTALTAAITSVSIEIVRIEIAGVIYGRGGFHFPR